MKKLKMIAIGVMMLFASNSITAQVSVNVNLGLQPSWGPVGYTSVDYYYLPDIEAYYDIQATQFIYFSGGNWVRTRNLPRQYRNYDLNHGYKVVLNDYHGSRPYSNYKYDKVKYYKGYKGAPQRSIGHRESNHKDYDNHGNNGNNGNHGNKGKGNGKGKH
ncbi:hypothetical protein [Flavobacterium cellulosilyticum]|uniref:DUF3300 domain-containing protein n=1 Tax=Flavobacterium cellulosilyticum TaxID=2541731 RepID=A0A4V2YZV8_9FLAO|nr:hypothetical protein [Flavobacterium cellulosilyticum]TDD98427.1 hypothetical protein E0F76_04630 [Flavobacterium cellulosilyticum]